MREIEKLFAEKLTENGDKAFNTTGNDLLDILFMTSFYEKNLDEVFVGKSDKEQLFARFIRDPRFGLGRRDLGRELMFQAGVSPKDKVKSGRFDDLLYKPYGRDINFIVSEARNGNELAKKWLPRLSSKNKVLAKKICKAYNISEKQYRKLIKVDTVESKLSAHKEKEINFNHIPSLAMIKYFKTFQRKDPVRFNEYLENVKKGTAKLNIATTNVYDIYKNSLAIDADLFFDKIEKIKINCLPIIDVSGSMYNNTDSLGKAISIGHYLSKCSTYLPNKFVTFSGKPSLVELRGASYNEQMGNITRADWGYNTNLEKVFNLLSRLKDFPKYLIVLSDMEFDAGSSTSKDSLEDYMKREGIETKIIWWNFNANATVPELQDNGNIYISGYSPHLLKFLETGFDGEAFLNKLLYEYEKKITD